MNDADEPTAPRARSKPARGLAAVVALGGAALLALPMSASASLVSSSVNSTISDLPTTPACSSNTGGDVDEEICLYVTNAMTGWQHTATGPVLNGHGSRLYFTQSTDVAGGWAEGYGVYWAGPFCAAAPWTGWNVDGGNASDQAGPDTGRSTCNSEAQGFTFGQRRQVQFWDYDETANSGAWKLHAKVGSVSLGQGIFRAANNDGDTWHGDPYCDAANNRLSQWVSCGAIGETSYNGVLNTAAASDGIGADRLSAGFYVQDFPVAIKVINDLPGSVFTADPAATPEHAIRDDAASTFRGGAMATSGHPLWWVGYRERLGHRNNTTAVSTVSIPLTGRLTPEVPTAIREQWHGATVSAHLKMTAAVDNAGAATGGVEIDKSTCTIAETTASGAQAKCEVLAATKGAPSHPAEVRVRIYD